ncbi:MAG TPA: heparan-alpha-glucosaminide N-acetyltransferase domain-containing protein [Ignavibacteriaceae bacterium]
MVRTEKKHRIIFIDLMRAFAVIQMVQGHTVDALLAPAFRSEQFPVYFLWNFMRGMTAPIFMFSAGTVFTYLFRLVDEPFENNPRVKKGFIRFLLLVSIGYILRYPTYKVIDFSNVTTQQWDIFFAVDVLQLIGFGLLFVLICAFIAEKLKLSDTTVFIFFTLIFFIATPFFSRINWLEYFPQPIAGYFYTGTGSLFPLFPWVGYVVFGGVLGSYLAKNPMVFKTNKFSFNLALFGATLIFISEASLLISKKYFGYYPVESSYNLETIIFRLGFVLMLNSVVSYISQKIESIPKIIILFGRNTLLIYIVHLIFLYGSAWNPGLVLLFGSSLEVAETVFFAVLMLTLMTIMVILLSKFKFRNKQLVT